MVYYDISKFIKNILYNFVKLFKYLSYCLIAICFIVFFLFLMSTASKAETTDTVVITQEQAMTMVNRLNQDQTNWYRQGNAMYALFYYPATGYVGGVYTSSSTTQGELVNYTYRCYGWLPGSATASFEENPNRLKIYWDTNTALQCGYFDENFNYLGYNTFWYNAGSTIHWNYNYFLFQYNQENVRNVKLYLDGTNTIVTPSLVHGFNDPVFLNKEDANFGNSLITNEFNYFFIDGNSAGNSQYPLSFTVTDITMANQNQDLFSESYTQTFELTPNSSYRYKEENGQYFYAIPKYSLKFGYIDGNSYKFTLSWQIGNNTEGKNWDIVTDFSAQSTLTDEQRRTVAMISEMNRVALENEKIYGLLNDDAVNQNDITRNMPTFGNYYDPSEGGIGNIFNALRTAFTSNSTPRDVVIPLMHNQSITIPSNVVSSRLPNAIIILIQSVYWYVIARYIIKDVASYVDKAKSGEMLDSNDGNIKTDLL